MAGFNNNVHSTFAVVALPLQQLDAMRATFECFTSDAIKDELFLDATAFGQDENETQLSSVIGMELAQKCIGYYCLFYTA